MTIQGHFTAVTTLAFDPSGRYLVSIDDGGRVLLSSLRTPGAQPRELHDSARASVVAFDPAGRFLAFTLTGRENNVIGPRIMTTIWLLNLEDAEAVPFRLNSSEDWIVRLSFDPTSAELISKSSDNTVRFWNLSGPDAEPRLFRGHVTFALDASWRFFASVARDHSVRLWRSPDLALNPLCCAARRVTSVIWNSTRPAGFSPQ